METILQIPGEFFLEKLSHLSEVPLPAWARWSKLSPLAEHGPWLSLEASRDQKAITTNSTHEAVAEVSIIGNLQERLLAVSHRWQSKNTDGSNCPSVSLTNRRTD